MQHACANARNGMALGALFALGLLAGCADQSVDPMQQRVIQDADPEEVLTAANMILQREFGRIASRSSGRIRTAPFEFTTTRESGTARDLYRGNSTMRRSADLMVATAPRGTVVSVRVDVERRDTERHVLLHPQAHRLSDNPGQETPIEADAATSQTQNAVWTRVRRDRNLERAILDELREQFARLTSPSEGGAEPSATTPAAATLPAE